MEIGGISPKKSTTLSKSDIVGDFPMKKDFDVIKDYVKTHRDKNKLLNFAFLDLDNRQRSKNDKMDYDILGAYMKYGVYRYFVRKHLKSCIEVSRHAKKR